MKFCPRCRSSYTDETLSFCLQDGAALVSLTDETKTGPVRTKETLAYSSANDPRNAPTDMMEQTAATQEHRIRPVTSRSENYTAPKQNTALIVFLTVLVTLIIAVLGFGALWFAFFKDKREENSNQKLANINNNSTQPNINQTKNSNKNVSVTSNANVTPMPTPKVIDQAAIRAEVSSAINGWAAAARARDLEAQLKFYAETINPYYKASDHSLSKIKAERQRVYDLYDTIDVDITNIKITPDATGEKATAVFDKTWTFEGEEKFSSGSVQQQLWFTKIKERWIITGEKDLKIYYVNNE